jgi:hypothetical protein
MRILFSISIALLANSALAAVPIIECRFNTFLRVKHEGGAKLESVRVNQTMKILRGATDPKTLNLDGAERATNSRFWSFGRVGLSNWETLDTVFSGDFGDVLSLAHDLGANQRPLKGSYKSTLVSPGVEATGILVGNCVVG